jgi:hypothetical protein
MTMAPFSGWARRWNESIFNYDIDHPLMGGTGRGTVEMAWPVPEMELSQNVRTILFFRNI